MDTVTKVNHANAEEGADLAIIAKNLNANVTANNYRYKRINIIPTPTKKLSN